MKTLMKAFQRSIFWKRSSPSTNQTRKSSNQDYKKFKMKSKEYCLCVKNLDIMLKIVGIKQNKIKGKLNSTDKDNIVVIVNEINIIKDKVLVCDMLHVQLFMYHLISHSSRLVWRARNTNG